MQARSFLLPAVLFGVLLVAFADLAQAQTTRRWSSTNTQGLWSTGGWNDATPSSGNIIMFSNNAVLTTTNDLNVTNRYSGVIMTSGASQDRVIVGDLRLFGEFSGTASKIEVASGTTTRSLTITGDVSVGGNTNARYEFNPVGGSIIIGGSITDFGGGREIHMFGNGTENDLVRSVIVSNGMTGGNGLLRLRGYANLILMGSSTYTNNTQIDLGTLMLGQGTTDGTISGTSVIQLGRSDATGNATLRFGKTDAGQSLGGDGGISVNGGTGERTIKSDAGQGTNTISRTITNNAPSTRGLGLDVASGGTLLVSGRITNSGNITTLNAGTVIFSNAANNFGTLRISNGVVEAADSFLARGLDGAGTLNITGGSVTISNGSTNTAFSGNLAGSGGFIKAGASTLTLTVASSSYAGAVAVNGGALRLSNSAAVGSAQSLTVAAGASLQLIGGITLGADTPLTLSSDAGGSGALRSISGDNTWEGGITLGSSNVRVNNDSGTLTLLGDIDFADSAFYIGGAGALTVLSGAFLDATNTTRALWIDATGAVQLDRADQTGLTGQIVLRRGTVLIGADAALGSGAILAGDQDTVTIASVGTTARSLGNTLTMSTNTTINFGTGEHTGDLAFSGGLDFGSAAAAGRTLNVTNAATTVSFNGALVGAGKELIKSGAGVLALSGVNTYSGDTLINAGALRLNATGKVDSSIIRVGATSGSGAATLQLAAGADLTGNAGSVLVIRPGSSGTKTLASLAGEGESATVTRNVFLDADLVTTSATGGQLVINSSTFNLKNQTLTVDGAGHTVITSALSQSTGSGKLTKNGDGTLTLSGSSANTYIGLTTVSAGVLELNKTSGDAIAGAVTIGNGATLLIAASNQVSDNSAVTLSGGTIVRAGGVSEVFGNLNLTASSFLDFGSGTAGYLQFGTYTPSSLLTVQNFFAGNSLRFGTQLTSEQLSTNFAFDNGFTTDWNSTTSTFTITAIPEPSTYAAAAGLLALFLWPAVRRRWPTRILPEKRCN